MYKDEDKWNANEMDNVLRQKGYSWSFSQQINKCNANKIKMKCQYLWWMTMIERCMIKQRDQTMLM